MVKHSCPRLSCVPFRVFALVCAAATLPACTTSRVRVSVEGVVEDAQAPNASLVNTNAFKTEIDISEGQSALVSGAQGTIVRLRQEGVSAGKASFEFEVFRVSKAGGKELPLASSRVQVQLGEKVVLESRAGKNDPGLRYFRVALRPSLLD